MVDVDDDYVVYGDDYVGDVSPTYSVFWWLWSLLYKYDDDDEITDVGVDDVAGDDEMCFNETKKVFSFFFDTLTSNNKSISKLAS